jgi:hypothetical protein
VSHDNKPKDKEPTLEELRALVKSQDEALKRANRERDEADATLRASRSETATSVIDATRYFIALRSSGRYFVSQSLP